MIVPMFGILSPSKRPGGETADGQKPFFGLAGWFGSAERKASSPADGSEPPPDESAPGDNDPPLFAFGLMVPPYY